ncbi:hypothetical protein ccbrp13_42130 [Ktedonobacteria bacterium brp13]|nr:hypothetical protein ccbrp13_42130 [Ktedonobacteria bacterium brp13]
MDDVYEHFWETFHIFPLTLKSRKPQSLSYSLRWVHIFIVCFFLSEFLIDILYDWRNCIVQGVQNNCNFPSALTDINSPRLIAPLALFILVVWLFERWQQRIPNIFKKLLNVSRPGYYITSNDDDDDVSLQRKYVSFLEGYQTALLGQGKMRKIRFFYIFCWVLLGFCLFSILPLIAIFKPLSADVVLNTLILFGRIFVFLFAVIFVFLVAVGSWTMGATGVYITKLSSNFSFVLRPNHPDGGNGFKWLGLFCMDLALPLLMLALTLAIGFFLVSVFPYISHDILVPIKIISPTFIILLTLVANYAFFRPLWSIHVQMAEMLERESDIYVATIDRWQQILQSALMIGAYDEAKKAKEQLDIAKQLPNPDDYSTWPLPFVRIQVISFLSPILIAVLGPLLQQILSSTFHITI